MKNAILWLIRGIARVISLNDNLFLLFKDELAHNPSEHLVRLVKLIKRNIPDRKGMMIIDVGAASGDSPLYFAAHFPECKTIGFEPIPSAYATAKKKTSHHPSIEIHNLALYHESGQMDFHITSNLVSSSLNAPDRSHEAISGTGIFNDVTVQQVKVSTLDVEVPADAGVLLIKLDTQGTELSVLKGATQTLKRTLFVVSEMNNHDDYMNACKYHEVDALLRENGFTLADMVISHRTFGRMIEYDAIYINGSLVAQSKQ